MLWFDTGKNNRFPFLDILRYLKNTHKKSQIWNSETSPNQGTWLGIPKISKNGNLLFFPVWCTGEGPINSPLGKYNKSGQLVTEGVQRNFPHTHIPYNAIKLRQNETKTLQELIKYSCTMYVKFVSYVGFKCILLHFHSLFTSANPVSIMNVNNCSNQITVTAAIDPDWLHSFLGLLLINQIKLLFQLFHNITCTLFKEAVQFSYLCQTNFSQLEKFQLQCITCTTLISRFLRYPRRKID